MTKISVVDVKVSFCTEKAFGCSSGNDSANWRDPVRFKRHQISVMFSEIF